MQPENYLFFRKAEDLPKIYEDLLLGIRCDKSRVTFGKAFHEISQSCTTQHCAGSCGVYRIVILHGLRL